MEKSILIAVSLSPGRQQETFGRTPYRACTRRKSRVSVVPEPVVLSSADACADILADAPLSPSCRISHFSTFDLSVHFLFCVMAFCRACREFRFSSGGGQEPVPPMPPRQHCVTPTCLVEGSIPSCLQEGGLKRVLWAQTAVEGGSGQKR